MLKTKDGSCFMEKKERTKLKIAIAINIIIVVLTIVAAVIMFTGFKFMQGNDIVVLEATKIGMLKFFTVESNLFMGIIALIFAVKEIQVLNGNKSDISTKLYMFKLMSTTAVGLTFTVVFAYLGPISKGGIPSMLMNSNLFFHLIIPILSMINFVAFERTDKLSFKYSFSGLIPCVLYAVFYITNILIHMENGVVSTKYDWYWFVQKGVWTAVIVVPLMLVITYGISVILWRLNRVKK